MTLPDAKLRAEGDWHYEVASEPGRNHSLAREPVEDVVEHIRLGGHGYEAMSRATGWPAVKRNARATIRERVEWRIRGCDLTAVRVVQRSSCGRDVERR
jgi:hypothetical protein